MRKSKSSERQIAAILKEAGGGLPMVGPLRNHKVSSATLYKQRAKYGGMHVSYMQRLREFEQPLGSSYEDRFAIEKLRQRLG